MFFLKCDYTRNIVITTHYMYNEDIVTPVLRSKFQNLKNVHHYHFSTLLSFWMVDYTVTITTWKYDFDQRITSHTKLIQPQEIRDTIKDTLDSLCSNCLVWNSVQKAFTMSWGVGSWLIIPRSPYLFYYTSMLHFFLNKDACPRWTQHAFSRFRTLQPNIH